MPTPASKISTRCARLAAPSPLMTLAPVMRTMNDWKHLQADIIKIDGCFVRDILTDPLDAIMVKSIVEMARAKQMSVVAEYVESEPQKSALAGTGRELSPGLPGR